jgi:hypothetical protein
MKALFAAAILVVSAPALAQPDVATNAGPQERDARGIPVVNEAPNIPPGVNQTVQAVPGATYQYQPMQFQTRPATAEYPPCERGQTDRCTQTYEGRGTATRARRGRR